MNLFSATLTLPVSELYPEDVCSAFNSLLRAVASNCFEGVWTAGADGVDVAVGVLLLETGRIDTPMFFSACSRAFRLMLSLSFVQKSQA